MSQPQNQPLQVYYDKNCPVCSRFIVSVTSSKKKEYFQCQPLKDLTSNDLLSKEFHVITQDGKIYRKFDGILKIGEMYQKWQFLITIARFPVIYQLLSFGYDIFAAHRYGISKLFDRILLTKLVLILVLFVSFLASYPLWLSERQYPQVPVFSFLPVILFPFDYIIFITMLILLVVSFINISKRVFLISFVCILGIYFLFDQSRLQPEFYQFLLLSIAVSLYPWTVSNTHKKKVMLATCCIIISSIYIYSGLQKANISFISGVYPWFVQPVIQFFPDTIKQIIRSLGFLVPVIETGIGIGLLVKKYRLLAIAVAICMHLFILFSLGPFGHNWNSVVWPWNIAMCCFVVILFWDTDSLAFSTLVKPVQPVCVILVILCVVLPAFSFINLWDSYLSASLYSGNTENAQIHIPANIVYTLNPQIKKNIQKAGNNFYVLDISTWSYEAMNVPSYPQDRVFKGITKAFCKNVPVNTGITVQIQGKPNWLTGSSSTSDYTCKDLL